jgi:hypothetical protein
MMPWGTTALTMAGGRSRNLLRAIVVLAALLAGLWAWTAELTGPYHFDDYVTPLNDPASQLLAAWREYLPVTLRPVTKLSYAVEAEAGLSGTPAPRRWEPRCSPRCGSCTRCTPMGHKPQTFIHTITRVPGHLSSPQMPDCVTHVPGTLCNLCVDKLMRCR